MPIRQPIVSVLGHVDHGKTTILDTLRGSGVADRECGKITQHIGATEVPLETIVEFCGKLMIPNTLIPGLLFIDTPGHHSFTTLRARGGALADLAILAVDIMEGLKPQTIESLNILKKYKTPFVVALNKVDRINGWLSSEGSCLTDTLKGQSEKVLEVLDQKLYNLVGQLFREGYSADRYDKILDFTKTIAIVPTCARTGDGMADLLMMLVGLAQRFLQEQLETEMEEGLGEGTVLEVKEEKGLGTTLDCIIYSGIIKYGDTIVVGGKGEPIVTKVKALLKPKPLDEIRDPQERFNHVDSVTAAAGVKIAALNLERVVSGSPIRVAEGNIEEIMNAVRMET
ncbi:MAG: translation initiation factor IF-2, partial [Candidatus Thermoplasmatota archaeon]|nr:translation initiation factor IF-2 [Candidatus Thermoplasmatota archaeon]